MSVLNGFVFLGKTLKANEIKKSLVNDRCLFCMS